MKTGVTTAVLRISGNVPSQKHLFIALHKIGDMLSTLFLKVTFEIDLIFARLAGRLFITLVHSSTLIGVRKIDALFCWTWARGSILLLIILSILLSQGELLRSR